MRTILQITIFLISIIGFSQSDCEKYSTEYIPVDLEEAFSFFECNWSKEDLETFKNKEEKSAAISLHRGYGMTIRNNWGLWKREGKLSEYLKENGIYHPESMSNTIFVSFHRKLNNKPIELEKQAEIYKEYRKKANERFRKEYLTEFNKFKVKDTIGFKFFRGYISDEQKEKTESKKCSAKAIVLDKRESDIYIKIQIIETCDENGIFIFNDNGKEKKIVKKDDIEWVFINDWIPKE